MELRMELITGFARIPGVPIGGRGAFSKLKEEKDIVLLEYMVYLGHFARQRSSLLPQLLLLQHQLPLQQQVKKEIVELLLRDWSIVFRRQQIGRAHV